MNKKHLVSMIAMVLAMMMLGLSCGAVAEEAPLSVGTLSYLKMTEEDVDSFYREAFQELFELLRVDGVVTGRVSIGRTKKTTYYDSLEALMMALMAGEVEGIRVPYYTGKYLCTTNDALEMTRAYHPENMTPAAQWAADTVSDGYAFMMKEENAALQEAFNTQIAAMKEDGTMQKLVDEYIVKVSEGSDPVAIAFDQFKGDPIRVAVTGSLPPMDYVNADGTFAGFNTALLAEIGRRLRRNVELVQVDSIGRALAIAEGTVDVAFWTRGQSEAVTELFQTDEEVSEQKVEKLSDEELEANLAERMAPGEVEMTEAEKAAMESYDIPEMVIIEMIVERDLPDGMIMTIPYFTDFPVQVGLK